MKRKFLIEAAVVIILLVGTSSVSSIQTFSSINNDYFLEPHEQWLKNNPDSLPIWLTPEELLRLDEIGENFVPTSAPPEPIRQPAEFEPMEGVLINYGGDDNFGISYDIIAEMAEDVEVVTIVDSASQQSYVLSQFQSHGVNTAHCSFLIAPSDSWWTRDYGPWFIFNGNDEQGIVDFIYNRPRPDDDQIPTAYGNDQGIPVYDMSLVHTGGNYMTDGQGISVSTNIVWSENSGMTHAQIEQMLNDYCGIGTYHVVPDPNGDYIKHVDCWGKYLSPDTILIREVSESHSQYDEIEDTVTYFESQTSCYGTPYNVVRVYTPSNEPYTNSLILNDKVLVPITGSQWDDEAIDSYESAMPGYEVLGFYGSWVSTDALHCRAKGIVDRYMLYIEHTPLYGTQSTHEGYDIQAKIFPYSGESLISSSTGVYWKIDGGSWDFIQMDPLGDDEYHAVIPPQETGTDIYYYIHAEDDSGRSENHPYIGESMAHTFTAQLDNNPPGTPTITGPTEGIPGEEYTYCIPTAVDPEGDIIYVYWSWGDGETSGWLGPYNSGEEICESHVWATRGTYTVKAKLKDEFDAESDWGELVVTIPRNRALIFNFFERFLNNFQILNFLWGLI